MITLKHVTQQELIQVELLHFHTISRSLSVISLFVSRSILPRSLSAAQHRTTMFIYNRPFTRRHALLWTHTQPACVYMCVRVYVCMCVCVCTCVRVWESKEEGGGVMHGDSSPPPSISISLSFALCHSILHSHAQPLCTFILLSISPQRRMAVSIIVCVCVCVCLCVCVFVCKPEANWL